MKERESESLAVAQALAEHLRQEKGELLPFEKHLSDELSEDEVRTMSAALDSQVVGNATGPATVSPRLELYRPLSDEEEDGVLRSVEQKLGTAEGGGPQRTARVVPLFARRVLGPLAIAAAVGFLFVRSSGDALPPYVVTATGGESELRGASAQAATPALRVRAGSPFELVLRPERAASAAIVARIFLERGGRTTELVEIATETSAEGAIRVRGRIPNSATAETLDGGALVALIGEPRAVAAGLPAKGRNAVERRVTLTLAR
ncbi:MAG: hypothetical protein IPG50_03680 [Myxococcales bacterium]|nr:hypothetical protein [Myxococcales bacterium]